MDEQYLDILRAVMDDENYAKVEQVGNAELHGFLADVVGLCAPESVFVCTDAPEDIEHIRLQSIALGEEAFLAIEGHTVHFDGVTDQGRDREVTKYLVPQNDSLSPSLNQVEREQGLAEVRGLLKNAMKGRTLIVRFLSLGPTDSVFSNLCVQCTDSYYVAHSEELLYRTAYEAFKRMGDSGEFFRFVHSAGKLDERMVSAEPEKRRIYMDYTRETIYSVNTQYAGNTVGLKKLALRLTIRKADREGWLAEHMFLMGVRGANERKTYFAGAFPSACGKTSTAMLPGETIVGDDIAYLRKIDGEPRAVNAEAGIFGIIQNVTAKDDPAIWDVLSNPVEVIFSNILINNKRPYWLGMGCDTPAGGENFSGEWHEGKTDAKGNPVPLAHKNARYAVAIHKLANCDPELENPLGVPLGGIMYGGRDAHAYVPVQEGFDWTHGIIAYGAALETETTFATIGKEGVPEINLMSIQDFLAIPLGKYIRNNLDFGKGLKRPPLVFGVNYFLRGKDGQFVNGVQDKHVWVKWMELRVHGEAQALVAPTGCIPQYADLQWLFQDVRGKEYSREQYVEQFTIRIPENLAKMDRVEAFHRAQVSDAPQALFDVLAAQRKRLEKLKAQLGEYVSPFDLSEINSGRAGR